MSDSFEKWAADKTFLLKASEGEGYVNVREMAWEVWQAALQSGEPVAVADRGVLNWIDGKQFSYEADLYTTPQPVAGANILISIDLLQAALNSLREAATHASPADKVYLASTIKLFSNLLSAGKGGEA